VTHGTLLTNEIHTRGSIQKVTHGVILLDDIWKIIIGILLAYRVMTCKNIWLGDSSLLTGHIGG
jgi:hypothetical protein